MPQHFGDRFNMNSIFQSHGRGKSMPGKVEVHLFSDAANGSNNFQIPVDFLIGYGRKTRSIL
jgi:hypothetical protein